MSGSFALFVDADRLAQKLFLLMAAAQSASFARPWIASASVPARRLDHHGWSRQAPDEPAGRMAAARAAPNPRSGAILAMKAGFQSARPLRDAGFRLSSVPAVRTSRAAREAAEWVAVGSGATITLSGLNLSEASMNVRQLIAELESLPADALVVTPAEPFGLTDSVAVTPVSIKVLHTAIAGVTHCESDDPRGSGDIVHAICLGPAGGLGCG
jgi:hypothetical protein